MSRKFIIAIEGMTSSSKDTICRYIKEKYGIDMIVSHTTRPIRDYETQGKEHWFDTDEEFDKLDRNKMFAYTKFPKTNYRYCTTIEDMKDDVMTYIINPDGVKSLMESKKRIDFDFISIYCNCPIEVIRERAKKRGDKAELIEARIESEKEEFLDFYHKKGYDYCIDTNRPLADIYKDVDDILSKFLKPKHAIISAR